MQSVINQAVRILQNGGLVAMPTETVYGLGGDAKNPEALRKIFQAKHRPTDHPLIVHLADTSQLNQWVSRFPAAAQQLADAFWPGPLTLILPKASGVLDLVTGNQQTIGIRIPSHPVAKALLQQFGGGIAAPSANRFGRISPTTSDAVREELGDGVDLVLEGGECEVGLESTIVDVSGEHPVILRPGMITAEQIEAVLNKGLRSVGETVSRVSGSLEAHYAPRTRTQLLTVGEITDWLERVGQDDLPVALMVRTLVSKEIKGVMRIAMAGDAHKYAHDLYQTLRSLDQQRFKRILIEDVPMSGEWVAIRDRLVKASFGSCVHAR